MGIRRLVVYALLSTATSCVMVDPNLMVEKVEIRPSSPTSSRTGPVFEKNYALGTPCFASVGQPVVKVKEYYIVNTSTPYMKPTKDMALKVGAFGTQTPISAGQDCHVVGTAVLDNVSYTVVDLGSRLPRILVSPNDVVHDKGLHYDNSLVAVHITPPDVAFVSSPHAETGTEAGARNFELLYSGGDSDSIRFLYREFTPDDLARASFFQDLSYSRSQDVAWFQSIKLRIEQATNEGIRYTVLEDGLN